MLPTGDGEARVLLGTEWSELSRLEEGWPVVPKSQVAERTSNPIRNVVDRLSIPPNPEKTFISLGLGDPTVFGNLKADPLAIEAARQALESQKFNGYPPAIGLLEAREAVARRYSRPESPLAARDVVITSGCSGALEMAISVLAHAGQSVLLPQPGFSLYRTLCDNKGVRVKYYRLRPEQGWEVDLEHVRSLLDGTVKAWLINNPSNPCGSVYSLEHLQVCKALAMQHKLTIIADEIYEDLVFKPNVFHPLSTVQPSTPMLACGGLGKRFLVPGWRVGWILVHDPAGAALDEVRAGLVDLAGIILGANSIVQGALAGIFASVPQSSHDEISDYVSRNAEIAYRSLEGVPGVRLVRPQGAFYMMIGLDVPSFGFGSDVEACERLIAEESVLCLPGVIFGMPNFIRIVYCAPPELIAEAAGRIHSFCHRHYTNKKQHPTSQ